MALASPVPPSQQQEAVIAQAPEPPSAAAAGRGVIAYPPAFFADARPVNAYDMVIRLPGFSFDKGATVRGLAGAGTDIDEMVCGVGGICNGIVRSGRGVRTITSPRASRHRQPRPRAWLR